MQKLPVVSAILFTIASLNASAGAAEWADAMVSTKKIDFGVIATGSEAKRLVKITNVHNYTVTVVETSTTCGCSAATLGDKKVLKPGESTAVEVKMNTARFRQRKDSNLIIRLMRGNEIAETRVPITAYIRTDVVFEPGSVRFGEVAEGEEGRASVIIKYAGRPDWDIEDIRISNKYLKAYLKELKRENGQIHFQLTVVLNPEAPLGRIRDVITIVTNDKRNPYVPLMVEGAVVPEFSTRPEILQVPPVAPGETVQLRLVVTGRKPFQIESVDCPAMKGHFVAEIIRRSSRAHVLPIVFRAPDRPGKFAEDLVITIADRPRPLRVKVVGLIGR